MLILLKAELGGFNTDTIDTELIVEYIFNENMFNGYFNYWIELKESFILQVANKSYLVEMISDR